MVIANVAANVTQVTETKGYPAWTGLFKFEKKAKEEKQEHVIVTIHHCVGCSKIWMYIALSYFFSVSFLYKMSIFIVHIEFTFQ